jgi:RNA polymerase sigma-70 factor (ECF subfamily)
MSACSGYQTLHLCDPEKEKHMTSTASDAGRAKSTRAPALPQPSDSPGAGSETREAEHALLKEIVAGNEDALRQLYAAYRPRLWRFVSQRVYGDSELTDSVLQDVFLSVWRTAGSYRGEASVATWLFSIARNIAGSARRRKPGSEQHRRVMSPFESEDGLEQSDVLEDVLEQESHEQAIVDSLSIEEAFAGLSPKYREVVDLVFRNGFTYEETGNILNIPVGTVRSRLNAARQLLARALAGVDREPS